MKEQFVTYEIALKLKELGFDEQCFGLYKNEILYRDYETFQWNEFSNCIKAPLWQQVIDWFEDTYKIYLEIIHLNSKNAFYIESHNTLPKVEFYFNTRKEAREAAILKAIELCKNN